MNRSILHEDLEIRVIFTTYQEYKVTFDAGPNGALTVGNEGGNLVSGGLYPAFIPITFSATPDTHYVVESWEVNGDPYTGTADTTLDILYLAEDLDVMVYFKEKPVIGVTRSGSGQVTASDGANDVQNGDHVDFGSDILFTITPDYGYELTALTLDGADVLSGAPFADLTGLTTDTRTYLLENVQANHTLHAVFSAITPRVTVTYRVWDNVGDDTGYYGALSAVSERKGMAAYARTGPEVTDTTGTLNQVYRDSVIKLTAAPDTGYRVEHWTVNGKIVPDNSTNTLTLPVESATSDLNIVVSFRLIGDKITFGVVGGLGGALIAVSDKTGTFLSGNMPAVDMDFTFTASPADGYEVEEWYINGTPQSSTDNTLLYSYQVSLGNGADILVKFARVPYTVTFSGTHGTVAAVSGGAALTSGETVRGDSVVSFTAFAEKGYVFDHWIVDGADAGADMPLELIILKNTGVTAAFVPFADCKIDYEVDGGVGGVLTANLKGVDFVSGSLAAAEDRVVFTAVPWQESTSGGDGHKYQVRAWTVDGLIVSGLIANSYTLTVVGDHTVTVAFERADYTVDFSAGSDGSVTARANGRTLISGDKANAHSEVVFTARPADGFQVKEWSLGGVKVSGSEETLAYSIDDLKGDVNVTVAFEPIPIYTVTVAYTGTGSGAVTATVNGKAVEIVNGQIAAPNHAVIKLTPTPRDANNYFDSWAVTPAGTVYTAVNKVLTLTDLTSDVTAQAAFFPAMLSTVEMEAGAGGTITARAGYGDDLTDCHPQYNEITVTTGQKLEYTAHPNAGYMVDKWLIDGVEQDSVEEVLIIEPLNQSCTVSVTFTPLIVFSRPSNGSGYTVTTNKKQPAAPGLDSQIRLNGSITFTVAVDTGYFFDELTVGGVDCLAQIGSPAGVTENIVTVESLTAGSVRIRVDNVTANIQAVVAVSEGTVLYVTPPVNGTVTLRAGGVVIASGQAVRKGSSFTASAAANAGYMFKSWGDDAAGLYGSYITLKAVGDSMAISAVFEKADNVGSGGGNRGGSETVNPNPTPTEPSGLPFMDVNEDDWFYDDVMFVYIRGLMLGTAIDRFSPDTPLTRGMIVTVLGRQHGVDPTLYTACAFSDVNLNAYYAPYIEWARQSGIVLGVGSNRFEPDRAITRQDLSVILKRYADFDKRKLPRERVYPGFADAADIAEYAKGAVEALYRAEVINGKPNNRFDPTGMATRAEVAAMLHRFLIVTM